MRTSDSRYVVAVVEDDARVLESLENLLQSAGHLVRAFGSAGEFLEHGGLTEADCLISDVGMPDMDGFELERVVNAQRPELPVILITGRRDLPPPACRPERASNRFFRKPFDGSDLLTAVGAVLPESRRRP